MARLAAARFASISSVSASPSSSFSAAAHVSPTPVAAFHVAVVTSADYVQRRAPHRQAHIARLKALRESGPFVGGGPTADGKAAHVFYRAADEAAVRKMVEEDPYWQHGAWTAFAVREFNTFSAPREAVPVVLDGSRVATIVEGSSSVDAIALAKALSVLVNQAKAAHFGGVLVQEGRFLALLREPQTAAALELARTRIPGCDPASLAATPFLYAL